MKVGGSIGIAAALLVVVSTALGAHIYRWEAIVWPLVTVAWILMAMSYERRANR